MELKILEKPNDKIKFKKCEDLKKYHHEYYINKHKEQLLTEKECSCGSKILNGNMPRHKKTKKHLKYLSLLDNCDKQEENKNIN